MMLFGVVVLGIILMSMYMRNKELAMFNDGICTHCGGNMKHFAEDSQGGQGYICRNCGRSIWTSWI